MSRLPRLRSPSPPPETTTPTLALASTSTSSLTTSSSSAAAPTAYVNTRKRKSTRDTDDSSPSSNEDDEGDDTLEEMIRRPRKIAALGTAARPIRGKPAVSNAPLNPSKNAGNLKPPSSSTGQASKVPTLSSSRLGAPKPVVRPRVGSGVAAGAGAAGRMGRGTSAPPAAGPSRGVAKPPPRTRTTSTSTTRPGLRSASTTTAAAKKPTLNSLQTQLADLSAARLADSERLTAEMSLERSKVLSLQSSQAALSLQLQASQALELQRKRELVTFADELDEMRVRYEKEKEELGRELRKKEREVGEIREEARVARADATRERTTVLQLQATLAQQSQSHLALTSENTLLQSTVSDLQSLLSRANAEIENLKRDVEEKEKAVGALRREVFESETVRRRLHNTILEMKGNIRVFCRVRPVLESDLPAGGRLGGGIARLERVEEMDDQDRQNAEQDREKAEETVKARMAFPDADADGKDIVLYSTSESAMGNERRDVYSFGFDRVFPPSSTQSDVFAEIAQLAQSCVDGYNVCVFAYGQTGSGKSWTMEGGGTEATAGMIPRAVEQVFRVAEEMRAKGWVYTVEGQFLEIYNETIHDLLTPFDSTSSKKHEIKHDPKTGRTSVTDATVVPLHSPEQVKVLLGKAQKRRSVAATLMNERSSRSHSVFTLRIRGVNVGSRAMSGANPNGRAGSGTGVDMDMDMDKEKRREDDIPGTGETCEGCLNLVDLAGSERLNVSFGPGVAEKERVRETQNINKSLSALGDVIAALGEKGSVMERERERERERGERGGERGERGNGERERGGREVHVPYRNSKLTFLLQNSLSGSSKTLMVLNLSPLAAHLNESLTSLRFATKVNNTKIGSGKKNAAPPPTA